jgi:predicted mannosyl-3-phosphoglycerate phosphatase (HAD superfamily)
MISGRKESKHSKLKEVLGAKHLQYLQRADLWVCAASAAAAAAANEFRTPRLASGSFQFLS